MPDDWIPNSGTQLERAIRALFISRGAATPEDCYITNDSRLRAGTATGITDVFAVQSDATDTEPSGNEKWIVRIENTFSANVQPGEPNQQLNRVEIDKRVGRQKLALKRGTDSLDETCSDITTEGHALAVAVDGSDEAILAAQNDDDMTEFTCLFGRFIGSTRGKPKDAADSWLEVLNFEFVACPSAIEVL